MQRWIIVCGLFFSTAAYADSDGDGYATADDCDDTNPQINPGAPEVCDGIDNDCDGQVDENEVTYWADTDGDGYGDANSAMELCEEQPGYVLNSQDCDDTNGAINPMAEEECDGIDNNCNNEIDEGCDSEPSSEPTSEPSGNLPVNPVGQQNQKSSSDDENRYAYPTNSGRPESLDETAQGCGGGKSLLLMSPLLLGLRRRRER